MLINVNQLFLVLHRLNNFKVTGGDSLGIGVGWVKQDHSQGHQPGPRSPKVAFKVKSKKHSEGHSKSFQGQT